MGYKERSNETSRLKKNGGLPPKPEKLSKAQLDMVVDRAIRTVLPYPLGLKQYNRL